MYIQTWNKQSNPSNKLVQTVVHFIIAKQISKEDVVSGTNPKHTVLHYTYHKNALKDEIKSPLIGKEEKEKDNTSSKREVAVAGGVTVTYLLRGRRWGS